MGLRATRAAMKMRCDTCLLGQRASGAESGPAATGPYRNLDS